MTETSVFLDSGGLKLEALMEDLPGERGVVMTHPHPLYGGEMHNNVVEAVLAAYRKKGFSTLRFNFRGVGGSQGTYDQGEGEQEDVASALSCMASLGKSGVDLAGYSFGAWVNARGIEKYRSARRLVMVSPPVTFMDFGFLGQDPRIRLVVTGSRDEIADPLQVERMISGWNPQALLRIIPDADHFYSGRTSELQSAVSDFLDQEV